MSFTSWDHPRARGEYVRDMVSAGKIGGSPPSARGILAMNHEVTVAVRITPERAGNTRVTRRVTFGKADHPRARGEYYLVGGDRAGRQGSPPSARGIPRHSRSELSVKGITPERAGNTRGPSVLT